MSMQFKRVELHDGTHAAVNASQVTWLEARDQRTTRVHFAGTDTIHVKGSVTEVMMKLSGGI